MQKFLLFTFVAFAASLVGCSQHNRNDVVVIEKTGTYHLPQCPPVHMAQTTFMTVMDARQKQFKPCPACVKNL